MAKQRRILEEKIVEILAGDIEVGYWTLNGAAMMPEPKGDTPSHDYTAVTLFKNIQSVNVRLTRKESNWMLIDLPVLPVMSLVSTSVFGPFGSLIGTVAHSVAGTSEMVCIDCELKDGRKFIARMSKRTYDRIRKM